MKDREIFRNLITIPPVFVRLDGRAFHRVTRNLSLERPYDQRFSEAMTAVCERFLRESGLSPVLAYTFSDEISLYFTELPFGGRVEKIDSIAASFAASALTVALRMDAPLAFDSRIIQVTPVLAIGYLAERQQEAWRNHLNAYGQDMLVRSGKTMNEAARILKGMDSEAVHEMMFSRGINLAETPAWQRRGILVYKQQKSIVGFNPVLGTHVDTVRTSVAIDRDLLRFSSPEGQAMLASLICL
jgi:tRNA(His) 5'-end guanylyltransferase